MAQTNNIHLLVRREVNQQWMKTYGLLKHNVLQIIEFLAVEDYSAGPEPDDKNRPCTIWKFAPEFRMQDVYLKLADYFPSPKRFVAVSFHETVHPMPKPYRRQLPK